MTTEIVINTVAKATGVTSDELRSPSRVQNICEARHIAAYALHVMLGYSTTAAGAVLNRDHASVMHSCDVCMEWLDDERVNPGAARVLRQVINGIEGAGDFFTNPKQK